MAAHKKGIALVYPAMVFGVDYDLADLSDGRGVIMCQPGTVLELEGIDHAAVDAASAQFIAEDEAAAYGMHRAGAYPAIADYLDAQVKKASSDPAIRAAGAEQEAAYIAACEAVKAKFPKPGV